jgi:hypothetical protein
MEKKSGQYCKKLQDFVLGLEFYNVKKLEQIRINSIKPVDLFHLCWLPLSLL